MALEINSVIKTPRSLTIIGTGALLFVLVGYFLIKLDKKQHKSSSSSKKQVVENKLQEEVVQESASTTTKTDLESKQESLVSSVESVNIEQTEEMTKNKKVVKIATSSNDDDQTVPTIQEPSQSQQETVSKVTPIESQPKELVSKQESSKTEENIDKKVDNESSNVPSVENQVPSSKSKSKKKNKTEEPTVKPSVNVTNTSKASPVSKKASKAKKSESAPMKFSVENKSDSKQSPASDPLYEDIVVYEFNFPRRLCGKLIGRNGVHVDQIRAKTHTQIAVRNDPTTDDLQIVCVSGRVEEVDQALETITQRFPAKIYPEISFKPISKPIKYRRSKNMDVLMGGVPQTGDQDAKVFVAPQSMFVDLMNVMPHTINTGESKEPPVTYTEDELAEMAINIHVTSVVNTGHVFIQVPSNPLYENLEKLDAAMLNAYSILDDEKEIPLMKEPIDFGTICAAPTSYGWHRAMVVNYTSKEELKENCGLATIKFLDYGGYLTLPTNQLRQLRSDFMLLPFQAIECYLDGIFPYEDKLDKGKSFLYNLIKNSVIKAVLTGYAEDGLPLLTLFITNELYQNNNLNNELIKYNFAYSVNQEQANNQDSITESFSLSDTDKDHMGHILNEQTIH